MTDQTYGDGLVLVVDDGLNVQLWLDDEYLYCEGLRLPSLDAFMRLRRLLEDVDDVAVLTSAEAREVKDEVASSHA